MRFWDASAIVPLLVEEDSSPTCRSWLGSDADLIVWGLTVTEATSAVRRKQRLNQLSDDDAQIALKRLGRLVSAWSQVQAWESVRDRAHRLLASHDLGAADSLQRAAALVVTHERPTLLSFVCLDQRLARAASKEGFEVLAAS